MTTIPRPSGNPSRPRGHPVGARIDVTATPIRAATVEGAVAGRASILEEGAMSFLTAAQRTLLQGVSRLGYANPFLPERVELERAVLGAEFLEGEPVWSYRAEHPEPRAN